MHHGEEKEMLSQPKISAQSWSKEHGEGEKLIRNNFRVSCARSAKVKPKKWQSNWWSTGAPQLAINVRRWASSFKTLAARL